MKTKQKLDQCPEILNLKSIIQPNIKLSAQQSCYFGEILPLKFTESKTLTEDTLSYLYSTTNSFSFFHRLFEINSEGLQSTFDVIKILENFIPLNKPSNPK
jgi:hypothetical protein